MNIDRLRDAFDLDADTGMLRWKIAHQKVRVGQAAGSVNGNGYLQVQIDRQVLQVHRVVFALAYDWLPEMVDHVDGDPLNNRPSNLRAATRSENQRNRKTNANSAVGVKGVCWDSRSRKWRVRVQFAGKQQHIGLFADLNDADRAARAARGKFHGEFARHE